MALKWVIFDVGETLFSEQRLWEGWADYLGVSLEAFMVGLSACIRDCKDHRDAFLAIDPDFDLPLARAERASQGNRDELTAGDLYPDALPVIRELARAGLKVGVAGNQPAVTSKIIRELNAPIELIGMSEEWNVKKPDAAFFEKLIVLTGAGPNEIAYVGDRLDNDVLPAQAAGMVGVFLVRGPWGEAQDQKPEAAGADFRIEGLGEFSSFNNVITRLVRVIPLSTIESAEKEMPRIKRGMTT